MALAGIRNAKALAWNSGSLEWEAQSKVGCGGGRDTQTGEMGTEGHREGEAERITQRDRDIGTGQGQSRGKSLRPQAGLYNILGAQERKQMEPLPTPAPFLLSMFPAL